MVAPVVPKLRGQPGHECPLPDDEFTLVATASFARRMNGPGDRAESIDVPNWESGKNTLIERWVPETDDERAEHDRAMKPNTDARLHPDGTGKKAWDP